MILISFILYNNLLYFYFVILVSCIKGTFEGRKLINLFILYNVIRQTTVCQLSMTKIHSFP